MVHGVSFFMSLHCDDLPSAWLVKGKNAWAGSPMALLCCSFYSPCVCTGKGEGAIPQGSLSNRETQQRGAAKIFSLHRCWLFPAVPLRVQRGTAAWQLEQGVDVSLCHSLRRGFTSNFRPFKYLIPFKILWGISSGPQLPAQEGTSLLWVCTFPVVHLKTLQMAPDASPGNQKELQAPTDYSGSSNSLCRWR